MSFLFGGKEILCDGCALKICDAPDNKVRVVYPFTSDTHRSAYSRPQQLRDVFPAGAVVLRISGWADDSGPDSPAREAGDSAVEYHLRHYCPACAPVALDQFKETLPRNPIVDNLAAVRE